MNTIYVLWLRQLKRYIRSRTRIIGALGQPLLFMLALGFGFGPIYSKAGQGNYFQFLVPGIISQSILFTALFNGIEVIWDRQFGFLKETLVAPVSRLNIVIGRTLGGATIATFQGLIVFLLSLIFGFKTQSFGYFLIALIIMFLIALLFTAIGTAIASVMDDIHGFQLIMNFLVMPLFFLSGALFPLQGLPPAIKIVVFLNPLSFGVDGLRAALINVSTYGLFADLIILIVLSTIALSIGSYLFSKIQL